MDARVFVAWLILACTHVAASEADDWAAGREAFERGDYESALLHFESARKSGLDGPAVHYNIAVCHFKLGEYSRAGGGFEGIAERFPAFRGLAEYNLGLVARRLGDDEAAARHFLAAYESSGNDRTIRVLASRQLEDVAGTIEPASAWNGAVGVSVGYDDNVTLRDDTGLPGAVTTESPTAEFFASVQGPWTGRSGFRVSGDVYVIRNFDAHEYDQAEIRAGALYDWLLPDWRVQFGAHVTTGTLGGDGFDRKAGVSARLVRDLGGGSSANVTYIFDDVNDTDAAFAGIAGTRQQLQADFRWYARAHRILARLRLETNDRDDPGVSPDRASIGLEYRYSHADGLGFEIGAELRNSDYDELDVPRQEDQLALEIGISKAFRGDWIALVAYRYYDNDSTDPAYTYDRNRINVGVMYLF